MEVTEPPARERTTGDSVAQEEQQEVLMSSKPLHRFVQREPRSLGIVILIFGCAELLMGFELANESVRTSCEIYIPFWQGALFLVCGNLSTYTEVHPSKKMVTVCLAMYVVSLFGIIVSCGYRISCISNFAMLGFPRNDWGYMRKGQLVAIEGLLFTSSLCVSGILVFLCTVARFALKSTQTQVIVQHIPAPPQNDATSS
uniref:Uncharacterized protein n=1 Tax=Echeneis naucrates TaxID=173247 RepID=A0A665TRY3_ECHNA